MASTAKRVATASGNHWVVMGLAICIPKTDIILCLPIHCKLHLPGKAQPSEATLAREMLLDVRSWFPDRQLVLVGDGRRGPFFGLGRNRSPATLRAAIPWC